MFKNVLIPISSEFYNKQILRRGVFLADKFKSKISLIYIIEKKAIDKADKITEAYLTEYDRSQTKKQMIKEQAKAADVIIFNDAKQYFKEKKINFDVKIVKGEFSDCVRYELGKNEYNLILMGFEKECMLNYRLLEDVNIPVWVEEKSEGNSILAVCSNLAPNKMVPDISIKLSNALKWNLQMLYVVDISDSVQVDENGKRSDKKEQRDLIFNANKFIQNMENKGINAEIVKGNLENETAKAAEEINASLVIVGREQKKKGILGMPVKNVKKKIAEKCDYSILFLH